MPFRPAHHGAGEMERRRQFRTARQHEGIERFQLGVEAVDLALQPRHLRSDDAQRAFVLAAAGRGGEVGAEIEQIVLDARQHGGDGALGAKPSQAQDGIGLVHRAIGFDARIVLGHAPAADQRGLAGVAAAGIDAREADHQRRYSIMKTRNSSSAAPWSQTR